MVEFWAGDINQGVVNIQMEFKATKSGSDPKHLWTEPGNTSQWTVSEKLKATPKTPTVCNK